jgi:hypothetical protein
MLRAIPRAIFRTEPFEIYSPLPVSESLERLVNATDSSLLGPLAGQSMTGRVTADKIKLERSISFVQNSFKPVFIGRVEAHKRGSVLRGTFGLSWFVKAFMSFWFGFCVLWTIGVTFAVATTPEAWFFPLVGIGMACVGYGIVRLGQWFGRNDKQYLVRAITAALEQSAA